MSLTYAVPARPHHEPPSPDGDRRSPCPCGCGLPGRCWEDPDGRGGLQTDCVCGCGCPAGPCHDGFYARGEYPPGDDRRCTTHEGN